MDIRFACPNCDQHIAIDEAGAGLQIECPGCQSQVTVPAPAPATSPAPSRPRIRLARPTQAEAASTAAAVPATQDEPVVAPPPLPVAPGIGDEYRCNNPNCGAILFESQLSTVQVGGKATRVCPQCRLGVSRIVQERSFWVRVPGAFAYPLIGNGIWILVLGTPLLAFMEFAKKIGIGFATGVASSFVLGFFGMVLINVVRTTCDNEQELLGWPDFSGWEEVSGVAGQVVGAGLLVFVPALLCSLLGGFTFVGDFGQRLFDADVWRMLALTLTAAGGLYFPMALLSVAMNDSAWAVNPFIVFPAIVKLPIQYLLVVVLVGSLWIVRHALSLALLLLPIGWRLGIYLPIEFFTFYSLVVSARLLGLLYKANSALLGWFE
jgi:hypothetical protein